MTYRTFQRKNGIVLLIRSGPESATAKPLALYEEIQNEMLDKIEELEKRLKGIE